MCVGGARFEKSDLSRLCDVNFPKMATLRWPTTIITVFEFDFSLSLDQYYS